MDFQLEAFRARYAIGRRLTAQTPFGELPPVIDGVRDEAFDGIIQAVRVADRYGRFGNNFYQILNALIVARRLGCRELELPSLDGTPTRLPLVTEDITVTGFREHRNHHPTLVAGFYAPLGFENLFQDFASEFTRDTLERYVRPVFQELVDSVEPLRDDVIAMHFRGGDVFAHNANVHTWYVQPPAAYYLKAFDVARQRLGVSKACLVFEDRSNPAIAAVEAELSRRDVPHVMQSATLIEDLRCLLGARHIVRPFGTFCEAIALLSERIQSVFSFRQISTQEIAPFPQERVCELLQRSQVRTFVIADVGHQYIPPREWTASEAQLEQIRAFPIEFLEVSERLPPPYLGLGTAPAAKILNSRPTVMARRTVNLLPSSADFSSRWLPGAQREAARVDNSGRIPELDRHQTLMRHRVDGYLRNADANAGYFELPPLEPFTMYTASCWVWIPRDFAGEAVFLSLGEWRGQACERADLKRRDAWQRIYCGIRSPESSRVCNIVMRVSAVHAGEVYSTCWQLEVGAEPTPYVSTGSVGEPMPAAPSEA